ncbi:MAG: hypothetical protein VKK80_16655, partial [Prochlorothrix sp.]|nr:hypothetical protein [Prochlorothrix sp.]
ATTPLPPTVPSPASPSPTAPSGLQTVPLTVVPTGPFDSPYQSSPAQTASTPKPNILLPKDSEIKLRYTGSTPLILDQGNMVQEVLIVEEDVIDSFNRLILPAGSQVIGRFEQGLRGTRFIAQAVALNKGNRSLVASSDPIRSDRQNLGRSISVGSGVGAAAGAVIGGGLGALGGAAAGAATGYLFTPSMQVIEPNQTVVIRLREDWE